MRLIYADEIQTGMTILGKCLGASCRYDATTHTQEGAHEFVVQRVRIKDGVVACIVLDESGDQHGLSRFTNETVRVD